MKANSSFVKTPAQLQELAALVMKRAQSQGADAAEVDINLGNSLDVSAYSGHIENIEHSNEQSISIRVFKDYRSGVAESTELLPENVDSLVDKAVVLSSFTEADEYAALLDKKYLSGDPPDLELFHPSDQSVKAISSIIAEMDEAARGFDSRVSNTESITWSRSYNLSLYANTHGFCGYYPYSRYSLDCAVMARDEKGKQCNSDYLIDCQHHKLSDYAVLAEIAASKACRNLSPKKISTRKCPVIFNPSCAKGLIGVLLRLISGQMIYRESSFLTDMLGKKIASDVMCISQHPHELRNLHSQPFDSEGGATKNLTIINKGVLDTYLLSGYSGRKLGMEPTGNAGGAHNVYVKPGPKNLEQMLSEMGTGLMVTSLMGQGINYLNGDYSRGASGFWVEGGEIQFPVDEITIAGNLRDMFNSIQMFSNDVDRRTNIKVGSILLDRMVVGGS